MTENQAIENGGIDNGGDKKAARAFRTIGEVAEELGEQTSTLRFWEKQFLDTISVQRIGGRRYYRPEDIALLKKIQYLLRVEKYTAKGVRKLIDDGTINVVAGRRMAAENGVDPDGFGAPAPENDEIRAPETMPELDGVIAKLEQISALLKKAI